MTDNEMIKYLREWADDKPCQYHYDDCADCPEYQDCYGDFVFPKIADRMEQLIALVQNLQSAIDVHLRLSKKYTELEEKYDRVKKMYDDLTNDNYVNYCEFYFEENEKLQEENKNLKTDLLRAMNNEIDACDVCDNRIECGGKECDCYEEGVGATDKNGKEFPDFKWNCMDWDFGTCGKMEGSPCEGCDFKNNWRYNTKLMKDVDYEV